MQNNWFDVRDGDILVRLRVSPGARRQEWGPVWQDAEGRSWLRVSLREAPEKGRANKALADCLSGSIRCGRTAIKLVSGETTRLKCFSVPLDALHLLKRLEPEA